MNRRGFLFGGFFGLGAGFAAAAAEASRPTDRLAVKTCDGHHEPMEEYMNYAAICIATQKDATRALIPCRKCGVLFALKHEPKQIEQKMGAFAFR